MTKLKVGDIVNHRTFKKLDTYRMHGIITNISAGGDVTVEWPLRPSKASVEEYTYMREHIELTYAAPVNDTKFKAGDRVNLRAHKDTVPSRNNGLVLKHHNPQMVTVQWFGVAFGETDTFTYTANELELTTTNSKPPNGIVENQKATAIDQAVYQPKHYGVIDDIEAITLIARSMTVEMFKGYCLGNIMKYRMRLGAKDAVEQDLKKAENYVKLFEKYKGLCHE